MTDSRHLNCWIQILCLMAACVGGCTQNAAGPAPSQAPSTNAANDEREKISKDIAALRVELEGMKKDIALLKGVALGKAVPATADKGQFAARFDAASQLAGGTAQENLFYKLAEDAARAGDAAVFTKSLDKLPGGSAKDSLIQKAVLLFAKAHQLEQALTLAKRLPGGSARDALFEKLAKGDFSE